MVAEIDFVVSMAYYGASMFSRAAEAFADVSAGSRYDSLT